jgi:glucose dehydrogenase
MQANKNGYFYVIDRVTGEFISAGEMSQISWARGMDPKGRPIVNEEAYYSSERGVTVYPVQMHNASQMSYSPVTGLIYVPINPSNTFTFTAAESMATDPARQNYGAGRGGGPLATPAPYGPIRRGADGNPVRGGILTAWDPATQKERWYALGGGQTDGGVLSTASNVVIQTTPQGRLRAYTADKGEQLLDIALPLTSGVGPPMTYQLDGKQYIAVMAGTGNMGGRGGGGGGGGNRGNRGGAPQEATAAAAAAANNVPPVPAPAPPAKPRLFVYALDASGAQR